MKIVHVEDYFEPLAGYQVNELIYASKEMGDELFLITSKDMSPFYKELNQDLDLKFENSNNVKVIRLDCIFKLSTRLILKDMWKVIEEINPDVVYLHGIADFKDLVLWKKKASYKIVRDCHMSWIASKNRFSKEFYFLYKLFFAKIINRTNKYEIVYALGDEEYEYLKKIGIEDNKIDFLRHGYNDTLMYYDESGRKLIREKYKFQDNDIVISYIGKFDYSKRPDLIFNIINKLENNSIKFENIKLLFIGPKNKEYMIEFNDVLKEIKKSITVVIDDAKDFSELRKYYSASDICIFPKETSLSSIHAQVCGCPVIMENYKSNKERVIDNNNLYEVDNLEQAANILKNIIDSGVYKKNNSYKNVLIEREYKQQIIKFKDQIKEVI